MGAQSCLLDGEPVNTETRLQALLVVLILGGVPCWPRTFS